jgi:integrase
MAASRVINQQSFHDGKVVLYQLENRPKQLWLCRIKVPNGTGYIYRGTGTSDLYEARRFADELLDEIRIKVKLGHSVTGHNVAKMAADFEAHARAKGEPSKRDLAVIAFLHTYAVPYFTKNKVTDLNPAEIGKFFDWRRENPRRKAPTETTVLHETSMFSTFLKWCHRRGHLDREIRVERPKQGGSRRPHFDLADWRRLTRFLREWVKQGEHKGGPIYRDRVMLTNYVLILANTGVRVGEARGLRWRDVESAPTDDPEVANVIVHVKGKTGSREVVARTPEIQTYFRRIWDLRCREMDGETPSKDGYVFCHPDGKPIQTFKKGFATLVREAGVELDREGERRTIYSLRHTYATFRLQEGVNHYVLARNMGTSVKMLEQFYGHTSNRAMASELTKTRTREKSKLPWE